MYGGEASASRRLTHGSASVTLSPGRTTGGTTAGGLDFFSFQDAESLQAVERRRPAVLEEGRRSTLSSSDLQPCLHTRNRTLGNCTTKAAVEDSHEGPIRNWRTCPAVSCGGSGGLGARGGVAGCESATPHRPSDCSIRPFISTASKSPAQHQASSVRAHASHRLQLGGPGRLCFGSRGRSRSIPRLLQISNNYPAERGLSAQRLQLAGSSGRDQD